MLRGTVHVALVAALASTLLLSSCASEPAVTQPAPVPSATTSAPVFATKEDALAAAEKVYRRYLEVSAKAGRNPSMKSVLELEPIVTSDQFPAEKKAIQEFLRSHTHVVGSSKLRSFTLRTADLATGAVEAYSCVDYSGTAILDADGRDVTPSSRADKYSQIAYFVSDNSQLRFDGLESYTGHSLC